MKAIKKLSLLFFLFNSLVVIHPAFSCTIISASDGETIFFGGNQDQDPATSFLVVDNSGPYGVIFFATPWQDYPLVMMKGINEMGLSYDMNWIPTEKLIPHPEKKPQDQWAIKHIMDNFTTVEEVLSIIFTYNWGNSIFYQIHFADKYGDAVVIHVGTNHELDFTRKPEGIGYLVSTNFNLARLENGDWSCWRYKTADKMLSKIGPQDDLKLDSIVSILKATSQSSTIYSTVFDVKMLKIYLFYDPQFKVPLQFEVPYVLDVKKELAETRDYRKIPLTDLISSKPIEKK